MYELVRLVANRLILIGFDAQLFLSLFLIYFFWLFFTTTYSILRMMRSFFAGFFAAFVIFAATPFLAVFGMTSFWPKLVSCLVVSFFSLGFAGFLTGLFSWKRGEAFFTRMGLFRFKKNSLFFTTFLYSYSVFFLRFFDLFSTKSGIDFLIDFGVGSLFMLVGVVAFGEFLVFIFAQGFEKKLFYDAISCLSWVALIHQISLFEGLFVPWVVCVLKALVWFLAGVFYWMNIRMEVVHAYVHFFLNMQHDEPLHTKINGVEFLNIRILCKRFFAILAFVCALQMGTRAYLLYYKTSGRQLFFAVLRSL